MSTHETITARHAAWLAAGGRETDAESVARLLPCDWTATEWPYDAPWVWSFRPPSGDFIGLSRPRESIVLRFVTKIDGGPESRHTTLLAALHALADAGVPVRESCPTHGDDCMWSRPTPRCLAEAEALADAGVPVRKKAPSLMERVVGYVNHRAEERRREQEEMEAIEDPLLSASSAMAADPRDWSVERTDAWIYGILIGWDDEDGDEYEDAMGEVADRHGWGPKTVARLRRLRARLREMEQPTTQCGGTCPECERMRAEVDDLTAERSAAELARDIARQDRDHRTQALEYTLQDLMRIEAEHAQALRALVTAVRRAERAEAQCAALAEAASEMEAQRESNAALAMEARAEVDRLTRERDGAIDAANANAALVESARRERDEARAEVERLRDAMRSVRHVVRSVYTGWSIPEEPSLRLGSVDSQITEVLAGRPLSLRCGGDDGSA